MIRRGHIASQDRAGGGAQSMAKPDLRVQSYMLATVCLVLKS